MRHTQRSCDSPGCVCSTAWRPLAAPLLAAWRVRACAFFILSRIWHHHVRLLDRLPQSEPLPLPVSLLLPFTRANIARNGKLEPGAGYRELVTGNWELHCAMPQNFASCRWQIPFVALTGNFFTARSDKLCSQVDRKRQQLSLSLSLTLSLIPSHKGSTYYRYGCLTNSQILLSNMHLSNQNFMVLSHCCHDNTTSWSCVSSAALPLSLFNSQLKQVGNYNCDIQLETLRNEKIL